MNNGNNIILHFKYCAFILIGIVVAVATEKWSSSKEFTTYLSNAATMTSLLLGVVAIFYSFISNDGMSRSLGSISAVTSEVREATGKIENFVRITENSTESSAKSNLNIQHASEKLSESLVVFENTFKGILNQNEKLQSLISGLPNRFDQLETKFGAVARQLGEKPNAQHSTIKFSELSDKIVETFLERSTLNQNLLVYACVLSHEKNIGFGLDEFCQAINSNVPRTMYGFLNAMNAIQLCVKASAISTEPVKIFKIHPYLISNTQNYFETYIKDQSNMADDESNEWFDKLKAVRNIFDK